MSECPDSVTASDACRDMTSTIPETSPWNPNARTSALPKDFVRRMDSVRRRLVLFILLCATTRVIADPLFLRLSNRLALTHRNTMVEQDQCP
jgi:hypothetical protein